jgi:hypothetical protein
LDTEKISDRRDRLVRPLDQAKALQPPLPDERLKIVTRRPEKDDKVAP